MFNWFCIYPVYDLCHFYVQYLILFTRLSWRTFTFSSAIYLSIKFWKKRDSFFFSKTGFRSSLLILTTGKRIKSGQTKLLIERLLKGIRFITVKVIYPKISFTSPKKWRGFDLYSSSNEIVQFFQQNHLQRSQKMMNQKIVNDQQRSHTHHTVKEKD